MSRSSRVRFIIILLFSVFFIPVLWTVSYWTLTDYKSPYVPRTWLSILADRNDALDWMVSTSPLISESSNPFYNCFRIVPTASITTAINLTFWFRRFFFVLKQGLCTYLSFHFLSNLHSGLPGRQSALFGKSIFFFIDYH